MEPHEKVVAAVARSRILFVLFVLLVAWTTTTVRDRERRNNKCGNAIADMLWTSFLTFLFSEILCVSILAARTLVLMLLLSILCAIKIV